MFIIRDREAGNVIDKVATLQDAQLLVEEYEATDKYEGTYEENFYEIFEEV